MMNQEQKKYKCYSCKHFTNRVHRDFNTAYMDYVELPLCEATDMYKQWTGEEDCAYFEGKY